MELTVINLLRQIEEKCNHMEKDLRILKEQRDHLRAAAAVTGEAPLALRTVSQGIASDGSLSMAENVMRSEKHEMHTREIAERIFKQHGIRVKPTSLGSQLWRAVKRPNSPFYRSKAANNTYGLKSVTNLPDEPMLES